jgi:hypothetical protein
MFPKAMTRSLQKAIDNGLEAIHEAIESKGGSTQEAGQT